MVEDKVSFRFVKKMVKVGTKIIVILTSQHSDHFFLTGRTDNSPRRKHSEQRSRTGSAMIGPRAESVASVASGSPTERLPNLNRSNSHNSTYSAPAKRVSVHTRCQFHINFTNSFFSANMILRKKIQTLTVLTKCFGFMT